MKPSTIQFKVYNWNPNGTNDVVVYIDGVARQTVEELTFGIDINNYDVVIEDDSCEYAFVPLKDILKKLAISPVRSLGKSYSMLQRGIK